MNRLSLAAVTHELTFGGGSAAIAPLVKRAVRDVRNEMLRNPAMVAKFCSDMLAKVVPQLLALVHYRMLALHYAWRDTAAIRVDLAALLLPQS